MAKASLTLANGTVITLEGTPEEVHRLLQLYSEGRAETSPKAGATSRKLVREAREQRVLGLPLPQRKRLRPI